MDDILQTIESKMQKAVEVVRGDMSTIRVGGAKPSLVQDIQVDAYGSKMKLVELAQITAPDPTQIIISPWDKDVLVNIQAAIEEADLGLTPTATGDRLVINMPELTEERRKDYVRLVGQKLESGRVMVRQIRQEGREEIDKLKDEEGISEDDVHEMYKQLDELTDKYNEKLEEMAEKKEEEIMEV